MKTNDIIHGFRLTDSVGIPEISATLNTFIDTRLGTTLYFLDRDDECKTFGICFKTLPKDDTGVFHILEHSVLCGSDKYPVKDPFTEVMKGSLNVYMNAFTAADKTYYPIASRNEQDYRNLISVYMDAVFHPKALTNKRIFMREGHRIDPNEDGAAYGGVVYNEMCGAYATVTERAGYYVSKLLFPDGTYSYDTGGYPEAIPKLTYEDFCHTYYEFYHPSGACIFLDGKQDLEKTLDIIAEFLADFEPKSCHHEITLGKSPITELTREKYPTSTPDNGSMDYLYLAKRTSDYSDIFKSTALAVLVDSLADSNDAPLKKAVLATGLCDNMSLMLINDIKFCCLEAEFVNVKSGKAEELISRLYDIFSEISELGIDKKQIEASLNLLEFRVREADFGAAPRGMVYMGSCFDAWVEDIHPKDNLSYDSLFGALREKLDTNYYNDLLRELLCLDSTVKLLMTPDESLLDEENERRQTECTNALQKMTEEERRTFDKEREEFLLWQDSYDSKEELATIPRLTLGELGAAKAKTPSELLTVDGVEVLRHRLDSSGIVYSEIYFDISDIDTELIAAAQLLALTLPDFSTESGSPAEFRTRKKTELGSLYSTVEVIKRENEAKLYFVTRGSALAPSYDKLADCIREQLFTAEINNPDAIFKKLGQIDATSVQRLSSSGTTYAIQRIAAMYNEAEAFKEAISGFSFLRRVKSILKDSNGVNSLIEAFGKIISLLTKKRATIAITGKVKEADKLAELLVEILPCGTDKAGKAGIKTLEKRNEGIAVPTLVGYAAFGANLAEAGEAYLGSMATMSTVLSLDLLMNEIRLKGGAYDTGAITRANSGTAVLYSYRDPSVGHSVDCFRTAGGKIRDFLDAHPDIEGYIINTVGSLDSMSTPRTEGTSATVYHLSDIPYERVIKIREEAIDTNIDELRRLSYVYDKLAECGRTVVVADKDTLLAMGDSLDTILEL